MENQKRRTNASSRRLQRLYDTGKYECTHRIYGKKEKFWPSEKDLPIRYSFLEVRLIRKEPEPKRTMRDCNEMHRELCEEICEMNIRHTKETNV